MKKPIVFSNISVDRDGFGCSLQPEAAVLPCHTAAAAKKNITFPSAYGGENTSVFVRGRSRLVGLGAVDNLFQAAKMSSQIGIWRLDSHILG